MVKLKQAVILKFYWVENEDMLKLYFENYHGFATWAWRVIRDYDLKVVVEIPKLKDIVCKTRKQNFSKV